MSDNACIFCKSPLNNSDEHIIPQSINGTLHSKELICHKCNSEFFGQKIDPVIKKIFNPLILMLGWENASSLRAEDIDNNEYVMSKKGGPKPIRPIKKVTTDEKGQVKVNISGDPVNTAKMFKKEYEKLKEQGKVLAKYDVKEVKYSSPYLRAKWEINIEPDLILFLNKIAVEFYAFNKLSYSAIEELCIRIRSFDTSLNNIKFCNYKNEVRDFEGDEVTHLILIKNDSVSKTVYAYIELFNVICCVVTLQENYEGPDIFLQYHQDVLTQERFNTPINLKLSYSEILKLLEVKDRFQYLNNSLSERLRSRDFSDALRDTLKARMVPLKAKKEAGEIDDNTLEHQYVEESTKALAHLIVYDFPYILEDQADEEDDDYNYVHSNFREAMVDEFIEENKSLIGKHLQTGEGTFIIDSFYKMPTIVKGDKMLITLFCKLVETTNGEVRYIKVKRIIDIIVDAIQAMESKKGDTSAGEDQIADNRM